MEISDIPSLVLEEGLDIRQLVTTGSVLQINKDYDDTDYLVESEESNRKEVDYIGQPVKCLSELKQTLVSVDPDGFVKKKILEAGGGALLHDGCTVFVAFSGYWENESDPFDVKKPDRPMEVNLLENGLLPGLQMAIKSMLVGEMSVFLLNYQVMYGVLGIPPRIKPMANCVFYIKLVKSILTPNKGRINFSEPNIFHRVLHEVKMLYASGVVLHKAKNESGAVKLFRKAIFMLHKCRMANDKEEAIQEKYLKKLYMNLAVCYILLKQPLKVCTACNELNRLNSLWNNAKTLYLNAKALRMIGDFKSAEKKIQKASKLNPNNKNIDEECELIQRLKESTQNTLTEVTCHSESSDISEEFKVEIDRLIKVFKSNPELCKLTLPDKLNEREIDYVKDVCIREGVFCNRYRENFALDREKDIMTDEIISKAFADGSHPYDREDQQESEELLQDVL